MRRIVQSFGGSPIYGGEFFDRDPAAFARWAGRLSVDFQSGPDGIAHSITLFQEDGGGKRHLDVCLWFDHFTIRDASGQSIAVEAFIAGGQRWWDGLHNRDPRTEGHGIYSFEW